MLSALGQNDDDTNDTYDYGEDDCDLYGDCEDLVFLPCGDVVCNTYLQGGFFISLCLKILCIGLNQKKVYPLA